MKIDISKQKKQVLGRWYKQTKDRRMADRIKAVPPHSEGWSQLQVLKALRIRPETVHGNLEDYKRSKKLKPEKQTYIIKFTVLGMTKWLHRCKFSCKKPKRMSAKVDPEKQVGFIKYYENLLNTTDEDEPIELGGGVYPPKATKLSYGLIRQVWNHEKVLSTTVSSTHLNLIGSYGAIDSIEMEGHFEKLRHKYLNVPKIHIILDHMFFNSATEFRKTTMDFFDVAWLQIGQDMVGRGNNNFQFLKKIF